MPSIESEDDPHGFWAARRSDIEVPEAAEETLAALPEDQLDGLRELLDALEEEGFNDASPERRSGSCTPSPTRGRRRWRAFTPFKGLTTMLFYGMPDPDSGRNPNWVAIGYPGPAAPSRRTCRRRSRSRRPPSDELTLEADVCVVGSGCGGGVIAAELARSGQESWCSRRAATTTSPTSTSTSCGPTRTSI